MREHTHILCRYLTTAVRLARLGRSVDQALANFDLVVRCSLNEACNYLHAGRIRVDLRMLRFERAKAGNRGDALMVIMCRSAESFARRVGRAMMFEWGRGPTTTAEAREAAVGVGPGSRMQGTRLCRPGEGCQGEGWQRRWGHQGRERRGGGCCFHCSFPRECEKDGSARRRGRRRCRCAYGRGTHWLPC